MRVWSRIRETVEMQGRAALASIVAVAGSAPREVGARLVLRPDGGFWGTVGGGALEYQLIESGRAALSAGRGPALIRDWPLGPELGQCCGGRVTTLLEIFDAQDLPGLAGLAAAEEAGPFDVAASLDEAGRVQRAVLVAGEGDPGLARLAGDLRRPGGVLAERFGEARTPVLLFGAGHVGRALALALAPLPFALRWIDTRDEAFPALVPGNAEPVRTDTPEAEIAAAPAGALVLIMTHSHPLDLALTMAALQREDFGGVGLIGSAIKKLRFVKRMREAGLAEAAIARLVSPIGLPGIAGKEPAVIAASVAAQLLVWREAQQAGAQTTQELTLADRRRTARQFQAIKAAR